MNSNWIDKKFIQQLSYKLRNFKEISSNPYKVNFSCPYCGDSKKHTHLGRAYLTERDDTIFFKCFNCSHTTNSYKFIQFLDPNVFDEFTVAKYLEKNKDSGNDYVPILKKEEKKKVEKPDPLIGLKKVLDLRADHPVREYLRSRLLPHDQLTRLWYAPKFKKWVNSVEPGYFKDAKIDEPRLIIPFFDFDNNCFAVSARSFDPKSLRYMTIRFDEDQPKLFGLEQVNKAKDIFVTEGPLDSLFLQNAVSFAGTDGVIDKYLPKDKLIIVLDNEPRNLEVTKKYRKFVNGGFRICIWPSSLYGKGKDINDYIMNGLTSAELMDIIRSNTFTGLEAEVAFNQWKKI